MCDKRWVVLGVTALVAAVAMPAMAQTANDELFPPNAKPGECYARVFVPPTYTTTTEQVVKHEEKQSVEVIPAKFETAQETVLIKEASQRLEIVPATYGWVEETVLLKPASKQVVAVPATYETVTEQVLDTPAHTVWKTGRGPVEKINDHTGEIMCLVEVPAKYKTVTKKVLKTPATTKEVEVPAKYKTVKKQVMKTPPSTRTIDIPAEYDTLTVTKLVSAPQTRTVTAPAEYQTVSKTVMNTEGHMAWRQVLCETNTTPDIISKVQRALGAAGYNPGSADGKLGSQTMDAIRSFQTAKGLAQGGLTLETVKALGL